MILWSYYDDTRSKSSTLGKLYDGIYYYDDTSQISSRWLHRPFQALRFDGLFAPAWVAYGHSFAQHDESDQALAASLGGGTMQWLWRFP